MINAVSRAPCKGVNVARFNSKDPLSDTNVVKAGNDGCRNNFSALDEIVHMRTYLAELGCLPVSAMIHVPNAQAVFDADGGFAVAIHAPGPVSEITLDVVPKD